MVSRQTIVLSGCDVYISEARSHLHRHTAKGTLRNKVQRAVGIIPIALFAFVENVSISNIIRNRMKKKHRRAVYLIIVILLMPVMLPSWIGRKIYDSLWNFTWWLKTKLRVYDHDPD